MGKRGGLILNDRRKELLAAKGQQPSSTKHRQRLGSTSLLLSIYHVTVKSQGGLTIPMGVFICCRR
jgi:hypothetical protein